MKQCEDASNRFSTTAIKPEAVLPAFQYSFDKNDLFVILKYFGSIFTLQSATQSEPLPVMEMSVDEKASYITSKFILKCADTDIRIGTAPARGGASRRTASRDRDHDRFWFPSLRQSGWKF